MTKQNAGLFFIIFPIALLFLAVMFDNIMILVESKRLEITTKNIIKDALTSNVNDYQAKVKEEYEKQKITTSQLEVMYENDILFIYNTQRVTSFMGKIFGINSYRVEVCFEGYLDGEKVIIQEADYE